MPLLGVNHRLNLTNFKFSIYGVNLRDDWGDDEVWTSVIVLSRGDFQIPDSETASKYKNLKTKISETSVGQWTTNLISILPKQYDRWMQQYHEMSKFYSKIMVFTANLRDDWDDDEVWPVVFCRGDFRISISVTASTNNTTRYYHAVILAFYACADAGTNFPCLHMLECSPIYQGCSRCPPCRDRGWDPCYPRRDPK